MIARGFTGLVVAVFMVLAGGVGQAWGAGEADALDAGIAAYRAEDYQTAIKHLLPLAITGNAEAQYQISRMHMKGHGVPKNYCFAVSWADKSARQNHSGAAIFMSFAYYGGQLIKRDLDMAYRWAAYAAKLGHPNGPDHLEVMAQAITPERRLVLEEEMKTWDALKQPTIEIFPFAEPELPLPEPYDQISNVFGLRGC